MLGYLKGSNEHTGKKAWFSKSIRKAALACSALYLLSSLPVNGQSFSEDFCCDEDQGSKFIVRADLLYWRPNINCVELDFGTTSVVQTTTAGVTTVNANEWDYDPHFEWNAGYRLGLEYEFACSNWNFGLIWTDFNGKGHLSKGASHGHYKLKFQQIDALFLYDTCKTDSYNLKPYVGARFANIRDKINSVLVTDITLASGALVVETTTLRDKQKYDGIGPVFGVQADWDWMCGFGLYGDAALSILYGKYKVHFHDTSVYTAPPFDNSITHDRKRIHNFDFTVDLALGISWHTNWSDCYDINVKLGFEHHQFFNHNYLSTKRGDLALDGGVLSVDVAF